MPLVTVVIPSIPPRAAMLARAVGSVLAQTNKDLDIIVQVDEERLGAAANRQRGLEQVDTEWVAFLDDDDEFLERHLQVCLDAAYEHDADYVYPWYNVINGGDPMSQFFGLPWDNNQPHQTTITTLVKTDLAQSIGFGGDPEPDPNGGGIIVGGEDYRFTLGCMEAGAKIHHVADRTWNWHHHGRNTSGLPNWD
jgi:glycosyltransferase involved in cell wall biosynthesis